jgi:hypothetical protein
MTFDERRRRALALMAETPVPGHRCAPPLHRLLWRFGVAVRPPHFGGVWPVRIQSGLIVAFFLSSMEMLRDAGPAIWATVTIVLAALAGLGVGREYAAEAHRFGVPRWDDVDRVEPGQRPVPQPGRILRLDAR